MNEAPSSLARAEDAKCRLWTGEHATCRVEFVASTWFGGNLFSSDRRDNPPRADSALANIAKCTLNTKSLEEFSWKMGFRLPRVSTTNNGGIASGPIRFCGHPCRLWGIQL